MHRPFAFLVLLIIGLAPITPSLAEPVSGSASYAGQENRRITSLSEADIKTLETGGGWGLAKPAELNGFPGPLHLLELKDRLPLSERQYEAVLAVYHAMRTDAVAEGARFLKAERALDSAFERRDIDAAKLRRLIDRAAESRARLREIHLAAHLDVFPLLQPEQIARYNALRGYATTHDGAADHTHEHPHGHGHGHVSPAETD